MPTRKQRGSETQNAVALYVAGKGWPHAQSAGAGRQGVDILGMPGLSVEVKARRDFNLPLWLRQAARHGAGVPMVVHRPDGFGVENVGIWPVTFYLGDAVTILHDAGYGEPVR
jgi:hypothetical protein